MIIKKFNELLNESVNESTTLYRVVPLKSTEKLNVNDPGKYYVTSKSSLKDVKLKKASDYYLITVKANTEDIDKKESEKETEILGSKVVALSKSASKEIVKIEPYKM